MTITLSDLRVEQAQGLPWVLPVKHLSASSLTMAMRCPEQYRQRYILGRKQRPGAALQLGSAEWDAHVHNYEQKMASGVDFAESELEDAYAESWDKALEKNGGASEIEWGKDKPNEVQTKGLRMAKLYHSNVSPRIQPVAVEKRINFKVPGVPAPLLGFIDLVRAVDQGSEIEHSSGLLLNDHKTSAQKVSKPKPDWRLQSRIYMLHTKLPFEFHVVTKQATPQVVTPLEAPGLFMAHSEAADTQTEAQIQRVAWTLNYYMTVFGPDDAWPTTGTIHDWACDWCGFRPSCVAWKR